MQAISQAVSDFTCEPHAGIWSGRKENRVLNLVARESDGARKTSALLGCETPETLVRELKKAQTLKLPARHEILARDIHPDRLYKIFLTTYESQPGSFENLLGIRGVGPKTVRALAPPTMNVSVRLSDDSSFRLET